MNGERGKGGVSGRDKEPPPQLVYLAELSLG